MRTFKWKTDVMKHWLFTVKATPAGLYTLSYYGRVVLENATQHEALMFAAGYTNGRRDQLAECRQQEQEQVEEDSLRLKDFE